MFTSDENFQAPAVPARRPTRDATSFGEGLGAAFTMEAMETDAWGRRAQTEFQVYQDLRDAVATTLGQDEFDRRMAAAVPQGMMGVGRRTRLSNQAVLDLAAEAAQQNPEAFRGLGVTREAIEEATRARYQAEYADAVETMDYMRGWRGVTEFMGRGGAAISDPTSILLAGVSGGTGSIARILAREAGLGALGEAVILPRQFDTAEYLEIEDPNAVAQIAMGAAFAGGIYGGTKALTRTGRRQIGAELARAIEYASTRTRSVPADAPVQGIEAAAAIDNAEQAILSLPDPLMLEPGMRVQPPQMMPERIVREEGPMGDPLDPGRQEAPQADTVRAGLEAEIAAIRAQTGTRRQPITGSLLARQRDTQLPGGGVRTMQIHPDGPAAAELRNMGITPRTRPGLFSRRGTREFDNLVASEWEDEFPGITDAVGLDGNGYLDQDGFLRVLADELNGKPSVLRDQQRLAELESQLDEYDRLLDLRDERIDPPPDTNDVTELQRGMADIRREVEMRVAVRGLDGLVSRSQMDDMAQYLAERGGSLDDLLDDMDRGDLDFAGADLESDDGRPFADRGPEDFRGDDAPDAGELPARAGGDGNAEPDTGADGGGARGEGPAGGPRSERTAAGDQTLIPGIEPITERQRLEQRQSQPLGGAPRGPDSQIGGLFDPNDKARMDLFSEPTGKAAADVNRIAANDMREAIASEGDFDVTIRQADGTEKTFSASRWLDEIDADQDFVEIAELCGRNRAQ